MSIAFTGNEFKKIEPYVRLTFFTIIGNVNFKCVIFRENIITVLSPC